MKIDPKVIDRFDQLIEESERLRKMPQTVGQSPDRVPLRDDGVAKLEVDGLFLLRQIFGPESEHCKKFRQTFSNVIYGFHISTGVLKSAKALYENGYLADMQQRITADVFDDFLERAEYLLLSSDYQAAAVVAGCVLEDALRKMCDRDPKIPLPDKPKLDFMNGQLAKRGDYPSFIQKRITAIADIRNKAAHGDWDKFTKDDVEKMILDVRDFMTKYFV